MKHSYDPAKKLSHFCEFIKNPRRLNKRLSLLFDRDKIIFNMKNQIK